MQLYLQLSKLGSSAGTTSSAALAKLARAAAAAGDTDAIQLLQKQLPGKITQHKLLVELRGVLLGITACCLLGNLL